MVRIYKGVGCECIQPILELCVEYPGVFCVCAFFCARRNMLVVQPVVEFCDGSLLLSEDKCSTVG